VSAGAPDLFQIRTNKTTATLYFAPPPLPYSYFMVYYSKSPSYWEFAARDNQGYYPGVLQYTIGALQSNTKYYFRIQSGNGCAAGSWGNTMAAITTTSLSSYKTYFKGSLAVTSSSSKAGTVTTRSPTPASGKKTVGLVVTPPPVVQPQTAVSVQQPARTVLPVQTFAPVQAQTQSAAKSKFCVLWWCF
jgi:hypothetical protein